MVPRDSARDPVIVPTLEPVIVPTLEPVIVPVREPLIVPTRSLIAPVLEPVMVPPYKIVEEESSTTAAIMIFRSRVMLVLLVDENLLGRCGMGGSPKISSPPAIVK